MILAEIVVVSPTESALAAMHEFEAVPGVRVVLNKRVGPRRLRERRSKTQMRFQDRRGLKSENRRRIPDRRRPAPIKATVEIRYLIDEESM